MTRRVHFAAYFLDIVERILPHGNYRYLVKQKSITVQFDLTWFRVRYINGHFIRWPNRLPPNVIFINLKPKEILPSTASKLPCLNFEILLLARRGSFASFPKPTLFIFFDTFPESQIKKLLQNFPFPNIYRKTQKKKTQKSKH
jgi:hypothetical protein